MSHISFTEVGFIYRNLWTIRVVQLYIKDVWSDMDVCNRYYRIIVDVLFNKIINPYKGDVGERVNTNKGINMAGRTAVASPIESVLGDFIADDSLWSEFVICAMIQVGKEQ